MKPGRYVMNHFLLFLLLGVVWITLLGAEPASPTTRPAPPAYEYRPGSFDGTGKWFLGR